MFERFYAEFRDRLALRVKAKPYLYSWYYSNQSDESINEAAMTFMLRLRDGSMSIHSDIVVECCEALGVEYGYAKIRKYLLS